MESTVMFKKDSKNAKKLLHLKNCVFLIYAPRQLKIPHMQFERYNTEVSVILPKNSCRFKEDEIVQVFGDTQRI